ncbi:hypothetical protein GCM10023144_24000 [Pigmentiphaga soli]|uniref:Uncharacterized protein n=1 Tax=Pigmentiphaga soli TaxID=1007095 RepID=A0ABP8H248_9BURK
MPHPFLSPPAGIGEIPESQATGPVAELYGDIRRTLGVGLVNLVYRHLATVPGALQWAWAHLKPHFASGALDRQAAVLRAQVRQAVMPWAACFPADLAARPHAAAAARLARAYNLNNSRNLLALTHLLGLSAAGEAANPAPAPACEDPACEPAGPEIPLPAMPDWDRLGGKDRERILRLNRLAEDGEPSIVAGLYRHLAVWPALAGAIEPALTGLAARGELAAALSYTVRTAARTAAAEPLPVGTAIPPEVDAPMQSVLRSLATVTIPKMIPLGLALHAAFDGTPSRPAPA